MIDGIVLLVFVVWDNYIVEWIDSFVDLIVEVCGGLIENLINYYEMFKLNYLLCDVCINYEYVVC